jgi:hypothetical protein
MVKTCNGGADSLAWMKHELLDAMASLQKTWRRMKPFR